MKRGGLVATRESVYGASDNTLICRPLPFNETSLPHIAMTCLEDYVKNNVKWYGMVDIPRVRRKCYYR